MNTKTKAQEITSRSLAKVATLAQAEQRDTAQPERFVTDPEKYAEHIAKQAERCDATFRLAVSHEVGNQLSNEVLKLRGDLIEAKAHAQRLAEALKAVVYTWETDFKGMDTGYDGTPLEADYHQAKEALKQWETTQ